MGLYQPIAHLSAALPVDLTIVDGICGDLTFEEGGNPVPMGRLFAGVDPVLIDSYAASLLGLDVSDIPYISMAAKLGSGKAELTAAEIIEINPEEKTPGIFRLSPSVQALAKYVDERQACSACYGSLIHALHRLKEERNIDSLGLGEKEIKIGQGFRGSSGEGIGIGACTRFLTYSLSGCPPSAREIKKFLSSRLPQ